MTFSQSQSEDASIESPSETLSESPSNDSLPTDLSNQTQKRSVRRRILFALATTCSISISLLCFPSWVPEMVAFWLGWHTVLTLRGYHTVFPLVTCLVLLLIRLVAPTPLMLVLAGTLVVTSALIFRRQRQAKRLNPDRNGKIAAIQSPTVWLTLSTLWIAWALMTWEYRSVEQVSTQRSVDLSRPIVCIGDSLTQGLIPDRGYPGQLESMVKFTVVNKGVSGVSTGPAIGILQRAMKLNPQVVIIELGGHDFLKWHRRSSTKTNLIRMIEMCRDQGSDVILMEIPRGFMIDPYASLERELAYEYDLELIDDRWLRHVVLMSPIAPPGRWLGKNWHLSEDGIHSNEKGSRHIAKFVRNALVNLYGKEVLQTSDPR